ncbi:hypothetical protein F0358_04835 [Empedobacter brevis]|uniref:CcmD family protein n=1 Tax=Empedobacter brevis NBRC 14943 = ATCC 43319 TaxID=1218108 RepID=A0A511NID7_9FLAO|nr:hypothetical protein [Empedobacter brevis]QES92086.1 hypothetical protein F0358_04835 [Empedobacter brevis]GEM52580.1 hypothetical protein EB1_23700 [Empedobacter brevis NBRC 14943 = ATCC 43319]
MKEQVVTTPEDVVSDTITNIFTYANYFLVAALVVLLIYMTIRDFKKKQHQKKLEREQQEYNRFDNEDNQ